MKNLISSFKKLFTDERGDFVQNALWIIVVVLVVAGAGAALAGQGISPKLDELRQKIIAVSVPNIQ